MHSTLNIIAGLFVVAFASARATTLAPELKAYDFCEAYYLEDGGVVIAPYHHGFVCVDGIPTPEGVRIMPGGSFCQYDPTRMVVDDYQLQRLNPEGTRAFFHQKSYRYQVEKDGRGAYHFIRRQPLDSNDFYLTKTRLLEWFDFAFPGLEIHPGAQGWRTRVPR